MEKWSDDEIRALNNNYEQLSAREVAHLLPEKTLRMVYGKAQKLGLLSPRQWSPAEEQLLTENYHRLGADAIVELIDRPIVSIRSKASKMGLAGTALCCSCGDTTKHASNAKTRAYCKRPICQRIRSQAKRRLIPECLYEAWDGDCALCGDPIEIGEGYGPKCSTVDQIIPNGGYVEGNIQWVHHQCNRAKTDMTILELVQWCGKVLTTLRQAGADSNELVNGNK